MLSDQNGFSLALAGLCVSLILGMGFRSVFSPLRIKTAIDQAVTKFHDQIQITVDSASLSLADGLIPEVAVLVNGVSVASENECWMRPQAQIDQLKLPVSIFLIFSGDLKIDQLVIDEMNLSLRSDGSTCGAGGFRENPSSGAFFKNEKPASQLPKETTVKPSSNPGLEKVTVRKLKLSYEPFDLSSLIVQDFQIQKLGVPGPLVELTGLLKLNDEVAIAERVSGARFELNYWEDPTIDEGKFWRGKFFGNLREGHYDLNLDFNTVTKFLKVESQMKHIPLDSLVPLLKQYRLVKESYNPKRVWISFQATLQGVVDQLNTFSTDVRDAVIEGDLGEVIVDNFKLTSLNPIRHDLISIQLKGFRLDQFFQFLNRGLPSPVFGNLGIINGSAQLDSNDQFFFSGEMSGLEFIFSNKGIREIQTISLLSGTASFKNKSWEIFVSSIKPLEGIFEGSFKIFADRDWAKAQVSLEVQELQLSPIVQSLMTRNGHLGVFNGNLDLTFVEGKVQRAYGLVNLSDFIVEGVSGSKAKSMVTSGNGRVLFDTKVDELNLAEDSTVVGYLKNIVSLATPDDRKFKSFTATVSTEQLQDFRWERLRAQIKNKRITSRGGWDALGRVEGELQVVEANHRDIFKISGTRDAFEITTGAQ